jgi:hypothetical protein
MAGGFGAVGQQRIVGVLAASETASGRRVRRIVVQPFDDTAGEGLGFGLITRQPAIKLNDSRTLFEKDLPVLRRPAVRGWASSCDRLAH